MSLQIDYRPKSFKTFVGNTEVAESLQKICQREKPPAAFLFIGPPGSGKTTLARIVKSMLHCSNTDFKELNAADDRGIEAIRKLIENMRYAPLDGERKVYLLDEAHQLTKPSQEALLKALEEPPSYVHWVICTTNPEALKATFKRRCHTYELQALKDADLQKLMRMILKREKRESVPMEVRNKIVELCDGSAGQALKLLDQVIDMDDPKRAMSTLKSAGSGESEVIDICRILTNTNMPVNTKWLKVRSILKDYRGDAESARRPILGYLNKVFLSNGSEDVFFIMQPFRKNFYDDGLAGLSSACFEAIMGGVE